MKPNTVEYWRKKFDDLRAETTAYEDKLLEEIIRLRSVIEKLRCGHENAEYDSSGAFCPDCGSKGTFPGQE